MSQFLIKVHSFTKFESVPHTNTCTYPRYVTTCSNRRIGANMQGNTVCNSVHSLDISQQSILKPK